MPAATTGARAGRTRERTGAGARSSVEWVVVATLTLTVAVLASYRLGRPSLWLDEAFTVATSGRGLDQLVSALRGSELSNGGLYLVAAHGWMAVFGDGEVALRSLSVVFAAATVPAFYLLARRLLDVPAASLTATALFALNPFFLKLARDGRMYSLALLLAVVSTYCLVRMVDDPASRWWVPYAVVAAAGVYAQLFVVLVIVAQAAALVLLPRSLVPRRALTRAGAALAVLLLPLVYFLLTRHLGNIDWVHPLTWAAVGGYARALSGGSIAAGILGAFLVGGVAVAWGRWSAMGRSRGTWAAGFCVAWFVVPVLGAVVISIVKPVFVPRYLLVALPGLVLTVGLVLDRFRRHIVAIGAVTVLTMVVLTAPATAHLWEPGARGENWRAASQFVAANVRPGDELVFGPNAFLGFAYYADRERRLAHASTWPATTWDGEPLDASSAASERRTFHEPVATTWLVVRSADDAGPWSPRGLERLRRRVAADAEHLLAFHTDGVDVFRYEPSG